MKNIITLVFLIGITSYGNAQILDRLKKEIKKSAEDATTKKTKQETEKKVDAVLDKILNPKLNKKNKSDEEIIDSVFQNADTTAYMKPGSYENRYTFDMKAHTTLESFEKRKTETTLMEFSYSKDATGTSIPNKNLIFITDWKNESSIMIDDNQNTARVISLSFLSRINSPKSLEDESDEDATFEKTGKTKLLNGYTCHQYISTSKIVKWKCGLHQI